MTIFGVDISNHQGRVDIGQLRNEGFTFVFAKVSEGDYYKDPFWSTTRDQCRDLGIICVGYHYLTTDDPHRQADTFVAHLGDKSVPAMLDLEMGAGDINNFWAVLRAIEDRGVRVRLSYIPHWYWERIGSPDISKVPGLIQSSFIDGTGFASRLYPGDSSHFWKGFGGRDVDLLQFTEHARVAGQVMDADAYRGTSEQLRALLGLAAPRVPAPPAVPLTVEEQRELLELARQQAKYRRVSRSPLRHLGEQEVDTIAGFEWSTDGSVHVLLIERLAVTYGDPGAIAVLKEVASAADQPDKFPDRQADAKLAQRILAKVPAVAGRAATRAAAKASR